MLRIISGILVTVGIVGGTLSDPVPSIPPAERAGYKILEADFHAHSHFGDGMLSPFSLVLQARRQGLDAIAITDHNQIFGATCGRWFSNLIGGPTVLVGEEITTPSFHMIGLGLNEPVTCWQPAAETIREIHRQGGIAIAAHPGPKYWQAFDDNALQNLDGTEVMHTLAFAPNGRGKEIQDFYHTAATNGRRLTRPEREDDEN